MKPLTKEVEIYTGKIVTAKLNSMPVNPQKFKNILAEKNLLASNVSASLGYSRNTISSALYAGLFSQALIIGLKNMYEINYDDYAYTPAPPVKEEPKTAADPESVNETKPQDKQQEHAAIYNIAYAAMYDALSKVIEDKLQDMRNVVYTSMLCALRRNREERKNEAK